MTDDQLSLFTFLTILNLSNSSPIPCSGLAKLTQLRALYINNSREERRSLNYCIQGLTQLVLLHCVYSTVDDSSIIHLTQLQSLDISGCVTQLSFIPTHTSLTNLCMSNIRYIGDSTIDLSPLKQLISLDIASVPIITRTLTTCTSLRALELNTKQYDAILFTIPHLYYILLWHNKEDDITIEFLKHHYIIKDISLQTRTLMRIDAPKYESHKTLVFNFTGWRYPQLHYFLNLPIKSCYIK